MKHYVIYIPGLGDNKYLVQGIFVWLWRLYGVTSVTRTMNWSEGSESFEQKLSRLLVEIDEKLAKGYRVSLVGASAGASAVVNIFARQPEIGRLVIICGKIQHPETISERTYRVNQAFKESMAAVSASLDSLADTERTKILNLHPLFDPTVPVADTKIDGSREAVMKTKGHTMGILVALTIYGRSICKFIKKP